MWQTYETFGERLHHWTINPMIPSMQSLILAVENVNKPLKNIEKSEYFWFTCNLNILRVLLKKKSP